MNIYLIRHTTPDIELVHCYGQTDLDVAETFPQELKRLQSVLPDLNNVKVYSSPLVRCKKLAEALDLGKVHLEDRLMEFNFGDWEMMRWDQLKSKEFKFWQEDFVSRRAPGGESFQQMHDRVMEFFDQAIIENSKDLVVVCHGGVIRAIVANILHMPLIHMFKLNIDFGSVSKVIINESKLKVDYINR